MDLPRQEYWSGQPFPLLLLLLSRFSCVRLCATPETASHQAPQSMGFSRQEYWNGVPLPSPAISFTRGYSWSRDQTPIAYIAGGFFTGWATRDIYLSNEELFKRLTSGGSLALKLKLQYFGHLMQRTDSLEKILMLGKIEVGGEGNDRGWDAWMASLTQWTWVWASSGSWWWTGKPGLLQSMELQRVGHDWATELNWTPGGAVVKNLPANAGDTTEAGSIPGSGRSPGVGNGNPLQYTCLRNSMDRRAWVATV